jgi:hypothetical protein
MAARSFPYLGHDVRTGKNAVWLPLADSGWRDRLIEILARLAPVF